MRLYVTGEQPDLRNGVAGLLVSALDAEASDIVLISPWVRDISLPMSEQGHFASVFGGHRDEVLLSALLGRMREQHNVRVLTKPPDEVVPLELLARLEGLLRRRDDLMEEEGVHGYDIVEQAARSLEDEAAALCRDLLRHSAMLQMLRDLGEMRVDVRVLGGLHAKLLWTPAGAILGSANFTHGGFGMNQELMAEVGAGEQLASLGRAAASFWARAEDLGRYSITPALDRSGLSREQVDRLAQRLDRQTGLRTAADFLRSLAVFAR